MKIKKLRQDAILPQRAHDTDAGLDLTTPDEVELLPLERKLVMLGFSMSIPNGMVGLVCPRSGLAAKNGITVLNAPGIIDSGYRGEVGVVLINLGKDKTVLPKGSRIAQIVIVSYNNTQPVWAENLDETKRGQGGFGSTS
ncbi:MAG: dUTP diphosphatase [Caldisericales bacterium]|nr:dUTP diphosphatase [bacterium]